MSLKTNSGYFDRKGNPISVLEWGKLWEDKEYRFVCSTPINDYMVKTIWTGLNCIIFFEEPVIFETRVYGPKGNPFLHYDSKYTTEEEALSGHETICQKVRKIYEIPKNRTTVLDDEIEY